MSEYIYGTDEHEGHWLTGEKIVRCRDCIYRYGCLHLVDDGDDDMRRCNATPDGFCAWGEK